METLTKYIKFWFLKKQNYFQSFARNDVRVEGWFKGELLVLFEELKKQGVIGDFSREVNVRNNQQNDQSRIQVDFKVKIDQTEHLCELKAMCISQAQNTPRNLAFYSRDDDVGIIKDFKKLNLVGNPNSWVLGFIYPKPGKSDLEKFIKEIKKIEEEKRNIGTWSLLTRLEGYPETFFISLWKRE